jgi:DNA-binding CsgD family transcriptional regulator
MLVSDEVKQFSLLVENIYDAALDANRWSDVLEATCAFVQGCTANLFYQNISSNKVTDFHSWGESAHYQELYFSKYAALNPLFPASSFLEVGKVHAVSDVMPMDEFLASRMYREWVQPQAILDCLYTNLARSATGGAAMAIRRLESDGLFDESAKARFKLLVPHFQRAVSIGGVIDFHKANESLLSATLDHLTASVILVAADGGLVYVNAKADAMLSAGDVLRAPKGRLAAADPRADRELRQAIAAAARGDAELGVQGVAIALSDGASASQVAHVLPLSSGDRRGMLNRRAAVAVFIHQVASGAPAPLETMARLYRLTAGEIRVLAAVVETSGVANIAAALGISEATVKTHLQRLFAKTNVRRQADLIKLLAKHARSLQV